MKRILLAVVAASLLTGCPEESDGGGGKSKQANGSFDGVFAGTGKVSAQGLSLDCESVRISIDTDNETYFNVEEWSWLCGGYSFVNSPVHATIEDGDVMVNGENYGRIGNSTISLEISGDDPGQFLRLRASAFESSLEIREEYNSPDGQATFRANLPRVELNADGCLGEEDCAESRPGF